MTSFAMYQDAYTPAAYQDTVLTRDTIDQRLVEMSVFVAATEAGEIVGTIGCKVAGNGEGHLRGMAVRPSWQGSGLSEQLLGRAESELRGLKCSRVSLDTTAPLNRAVRFYEKNGFRFSGKVGDFFGMPLFEYVKAL